MLTAVGPFGIEELLSIKGDWRDKWLTRPHQRSRELVEMANFQAIKLLFSNVAGIKIDEPMLDLFLIHSQLDQSAMQMISPKMLAVLFQKFVTEMDFEELKWIFRTYICFYCFMLQSYYHLAYARSRKGYYTEF